MRGRGALGSSTSWDCIGKISLLDSLSPIALRWRNRLEHHRAHGQDGDQDEACKDPDGEHTVVWGANGSKPDDVEAHAGDNMDSNTRNS